MELIGIVATLAGTFLGFLFGLKVGRVESVSLLTVLKVCGIAAIFILPQIGFAVFLRAMLS